LLQDGFNLELQARQVALDDCPHYVYINAEIIVNQDVTHTDDFRPRHLGMLVFQVRRERAGCLTDDLQMVDDQV
jgi:hypothetical protein